ncbi:hypothetical protein SDC9_07752 [bioreactor metagenome]|uniref:Uncharacterized protein n=1 Tax=bioreactor metagenome TaxID=1076179 RepID=A0A644T5U7_9ZZZZ|nr:hypothetical protein [Candidatus Elulimicrobiales bacterium]
MDSLELDLNNEYKEKLDKVFEEFSTASSNVFLLETKNREIVYKYFEDKIKNKEDVNESLFINLKIFDIAKAREIISYGNTNFSHNNFILVSFYSINREAQNALLKFLEESPENIKVLFIVHKGINLISTVLSRLYRLDISEEEILSKNAEDEFFMRAVEKFLTTKPVQRMKLKEISEILDRKDEYAFEFEDKERKDRESLEKFLLALHDYLVQNHESFILEAKNDDELDNSDNEKFKMFNYQNKEFLSDIEDVIESVKYAKNNSSSGKTLLEYLSLKLPEIQN